MRTRLAIVTQGFALGGGVSSVASWLRTGFKQRGYEVVVFDVASSARDMYSRRLTSPATWRRGPVGMPDPDDPGLVHWGAAWVEIEGQRYRARSSLTAALNGFDVVQVVAGAPALALTVERVSAPTVLQVATTLLAERRAQLPGMPAGKRAVKTLSLGRLHQLEVAGVRCVDEVVVENRPMVEWVLGQGQDRVTLAPPGIDTDRFCPLGPWDANRPVVAFGRLNDSRKDWPTAVRAFELFLERTGRANTLVLAGQGPMTPELERSLADSPARNRITVREDVGEAVLPGLLASGSVFLQSSREEGLGLAGLEAMACGLPVVATATVGARQYVRDGGNGVLVPLGPGAVDGLAAGLARLLTDGRGHAAARAALTTCREDFSSASSLDRFEEVYARILR